MANLKNYIETVVRLNASKAIKSADDLFSRMKSGSKSSATELKKVDKGLNKVGTSAKAAGGSVKKGFGGLGKMFAGMKGAITSAIPALNAFKGALISTGVGAIVVALGSFVALMIKAAKTGAAFGKSMSTLKGISGATAQELTILSDQAKALGASTAFTASQVVELQTELAKLGFSAKEVGNATPAILDLAASLDVGLAEAAEFAGSTVRAFGLDASDTGRVVDVMASAAVNSAQSFGSLVESFKLAAPTSRALGVSVEKTSALLGALANNGLKGSIAGTGLSKTFIMLAKQGMTLEEGLDAVTNSSDKLNTAVELVGVIGAKTLLTLAASGDDIAYLTAKMEEAEGTAAALAKIKLDNLSGDVTKLGSAWEGFLLGIEDGTGMMVAMARSVVQATTSFIGFFTSTKKVSEGMEENRVALFQQRNELAQLDKTLADTTASSEELLIAEGDRKQLVEDLIAAHPEFLGGLDAETASAKDLEEGLSKVNEAMIARIGLQEQQQEIDEQNEDTSDALVDLLNAEAEASEKAAKASAKLAEANIEITAGSPVEILAQLEEVLIKESKAAASNTEEAKLSRREREKLMRTIQSLKGATEDVVDAEKDYAEELEITNGLIDKKIKRQDEINKKLGLDKDKKEDKKEEGGESDAERETREALEAEEAAKKRQEQAAKDLDKRRKKDASNAQKLKETLIKEEENLDAVTAEQKLELEKQRRIKSVEALLVDDATKKELLSQIEDQYDREEDILKNKRKEEFKKFADAQEELTKEEKIEKRREAKLLELEELVASETEKRELAKQINDQYDQLQLDEQMKKAMAEAEVQIEIDQMKLDAKLAAGENTLALELEILERRRQQELLNTELTASQIESINKRYEANASKIRKTSEDAKKASEKKSLNDAMDGAAAAFGIAQEVAVAKMIIAAPEAIAGSFKEAAKNYAPPMSIAMGALGAAGTIAPIIKGLADIKKTRFSGSKKGPPSQSISGAGGASGGGITPSVIENVASQNAARLGLDNELGNGASSAAANNVMGGSSANVTFSEGSYQDFRRQVEFKEDKSSL
jgi:hypothetical protein